MSAISSEIYSYRNSRFEIQEDAPENATKVPITVQKVDINIDPVTTDATAIGEDKTTEVIAYDWSIKLSIQKRYGQEPSRSTVNLKSGNVLWFWIYPNKALLTSFWKFPVIIVKESEVHENGKEVGVEIEAKAYGKLGTFSRPTYS